MGLLRLGGLLGDNGTFPALKRNRTCVQSRRLVLPMACTKTPILDSRARQEGLREGRFRTRDQLSLRGLTMKMILKNIAAPAGAMGPIPAVKGL